LGISVDWTSDRSTVVCPSRMNGLLRDPGTGQTTMMGQKTS